MSILLSSEIRENIKNGKIVVTPFNEKNLAVNSIDVTLSKYITTYEPLKIINVNGCKMFVRDIDKMKLMKNYINESPFKKFLSFLGLRRAIHKIYISMSEENETFDYIIPDDGIIFSDEVLYLGSTNEVAGSEHFVPMYDGRSSTARLGFESHISAGFGDIGFVSNWTLEIRVTQPVKVYHGQRVGQVYFHKVDEDLVKSIDKKDLYHGKYNNQPKPQKSKMYLDSELFDNIEKQH